MVCNTLSHPVVIQAHQFIASILVYILTLTDSHFVLFEVIVYVRVFVSIVYSFEVAYFAVVMSQTVNLTSRFSQFSVYGHNSIVDPVFVVEY